MNDDLFEKIINEAKAKLEKDDRFFIFVVNSEDDSVVYHGGKGCPGCLLTIINELQEEGEFPHNDPAWVTRKVH